MNKVSIMPICSLYSTESFEGSQRHEVFFESSYREKSMELGLFVFLKPEMHNTGNFGVRFDKDFELTLKKIGQCISMERYGWSVEDFVKEFGKSYLEEDEKRMLSRY